MDLTLPENIRNLLKRHDARAQKRLGQHFLTDKTFLFKTIEAAELNSKDIALEIGPGIGSLTQELAKAAGRVVAVEKDRKMIEVLGETLAETQNVEIVQADALKFQMSKPYKLVANLPYYITSPVIRKFLEAENPPELMVLMIQKEVAQRICARPPEMSLLTVAVQFYAKPQIVCHVPKSAFWPQPKVDSAIIKLQIGPTIESEVGREQFFKIVRTGFSQPRKQLINNFCTGFGTSRQQAEAWLLENGIQPSQRAETLTVEDWIKLTKSFKMKE